MHYAGSVYGFKKLINHLNFNLLAQFIGLKKLIFLLKSYKNKPTLPRAIWDPLTHLG